MDQQKLTKGIKYNVMNLKVTGWSHENYEGYNAWLYFDEDGYYLGPDQHGVEPYFDTIDDDEAMFYV